MHTLPECIMCLLITPSPDRDSVKPKPQLCVNQNNNPQRFLLPPFPDTLRESLAALERIHGGSPALQTRLQGPPTAPSGPGAPDCTRVCVCLPQKQDVSWTPTEVDKDG